MPRNARLKMKLGRITKVALNTPPVPMNLATSLANTVSHLTKISFVIDPISVSEISVARFKRELRNAAHAT